MVANIADLLLMNEHLAKERKETDALVAEALALGIPIPRDPGWWWIDGEVRLSVSPEQWGLIGSDYEYLTELGKAGTKRLIRDERRKLESDAQQAKQWRLTIWGVVIGWILGIAGIVIAVIKK